MFTLLKNVFTDIFILYKNFFHFNLSKILNFLLAILYTIVFTAPFILIINFYIGFITETGNISNFYKSIYFILNGLIFFILITSFLYYFILETKLNLSYLSGERLSFLKNYYFNFKLLGKYFKLMLLNFILFLILYIAFELVFGILIYFIGGWNNVTDAIELSNIFPFVMGLFGILTFFIGLYLLYVVIFSLVILVDESKGKNFQKIIYYLKKSFKLTKGVAKITKFGVLTIIIFIFTLPIFLPLLGLIVSNIDLSNYIEYKTNGKTINNNEFYYIESLKSQFGDQDIKDLEIELQNTIYYKRFMQILYFLLIIGLFEMMIVSFYKRELLKENIIIKKGKKLENKEEEKIEINHNTEQKIKVSKKSTDKKEEIKKKKVTTKKQTTKKASSKIKKEENKVVKRGRGRPRKTEK